MTTPLHRPEPLLHHSARTIDRERPPAWWAARLLAGDALLVDDHYRTGDLVLAALQALLPAPPATAPFASRQAHRRDHRAASLRLLAPVRRPRPGAPARMAIGDGSQNGFLSELYPELTSFFLPFVQVQELHGAWERYEAGVHLAVIGRRVHPYFGTYAPTRTSHLELFGTWLSQYGGARGAAVDVGAGSGVLAWMLARAGFASVLATDINPNAAHSVALDVARATPAPAIRAQCADLLGEPGPLYDLVVFNPPWIRGEVDGLLDTALYFDDALFPRFFDRAADQLAPGGRVVLVFSNVNELVQPDADNPINAELASGRFRLINKLQRRVQPPKGPGGAHRRSRERVEVWELGRNE